MKNILFLFLSIFCLILKSQIIVIDPGHGYDASGGNPDGRTATEINTALEVGLRLNTLLTQDCSNLMVYMTRNTANGWTSVTQRAAMSNSWNADYYLSIHCNGGGGTGTETFWCNENDASSTDDIAFSNAIQGKMTLHGNWANRRTVEDDSYLNYHLGVLKHSNATGCLNEIGFVDHAVDAPKLNSSAWRDSFALAYKNAIETIVGSCSTNTTSTLTATNDYCGSEIMLQSNSTCNYTNGTLQGATSSFTHTPSCDGFSGTPAKKDVFYSFNSTSTMHAIEVDPSGTGTSAVDAVVAVYTGTTCNTLSEIACTAGNGSDGGVTKQLNLSGLTIGKKYWIRVYDYGAVDPTNYQFQICLTNNVTTHLNPSYEKNAITIYPNPCEDSFHVIIDTEGSSSKYRIINSIGQEARHGIFTEKDNLLTMTEQASGIYFIEITTQEKVSIYKLIKK